MTRLHALVAAALLAPLGCDAGFGVPGALCPGCNVILVSLDTLRADHLGAYGYERETSPCIDRFAAESVRFDAAFSHSSWTLPSHMSLFTSLYPTQHGVTARDRRLGRNVETLARVLQRHGYETAGFTAGYNISATFGFDRGFDTYREISPRAKTPGKGSRLAEILTSALPWLERRGGNRFLLFLHSFDTHGPYLAHEHLARFDDGYEGVLGVLRDDAEFRQSALHREFRHLETSGVFTINDFYGRVINRDRIVLSDADRDYLVALYDNEIRFVDDSFCALLEELRALDLERRTIVVLTSDHGESFFERGDMGHGGTPWDELIRVPLIVRVPGHSPAVSGKLAQGIDVAPTILGVVGVAVPDAFQGRPLWPLAAPGGEFVAAEAGEEAAIRTHRWKLVARPDRTRLYDLQADPSELRDVASEHPAVAAELKERLLHTLDRVELDEAQRDALEALGYAE